MAGALEVHGGLPAGNQIHTPYFRVYSSLSALNGDTTLTTAHVGRVALLTDSAGNPVSEWILLAVTNEVPSWGSLGQTDDFLFTLTAGSTASAGTLTLPTTVLGASGSVSVTPNMTAAELIAAMAELACIGSTYNVSVSDDDTLVDGYTVSGLTMNGSVNVSAGNGFYAPVSTSIVNTLPLGDSSCSLLYQNTSATRWYLGLFTSGMANVNYWSLFEIFDDVQPNFNTLNSTSVSSTWYFSGSSIVAPISVIGGNTGRNIFAIRYIGVLSGTEFAAPTVTGTGWTISGLSLGGKTLSEALQSSNNLSDLMNVSIAQENLGLGTAATQNSSSFDAAGAATAAQAAAETYAQTEAAAAQAAAIAASDPIGSATAAVAAIPKASTGVLGLSEPDGSSIQSSSGILSIIPAWVSAQIAAASITASQIISGMLGLARGGTGADLSIGTGYLKKLTGGGSCSLGNIAASDVPIDNSTIKAIGGVLVVSSSAGGSGAARQSQTVMSAALAANSIDSSKTITLGKSIIIAQVEANVACWVRIYASAAMQAGDAGRAQGTEASQASAPVAEYILSGAYLSVVCVPPPIAMNMENTPDSALPITIMNISGATADVEITVDALVLE